MIKKMQQKVNQIPLEAKVSIAYIICSIIQNCFSFITLPLFTRLLTKTQYGQATIYSSWSSLLAIFLTLNLAYGSFSKAMIKFADKKDAYISSVEGICLLLATLFFIVYLPFNRIWNKLFELPTYIIAVMVFDIITITAIQLWNGKKRFEFKYKEVIFLTLATSIFSIIFQILFVSISVEKGYARIIGSALVNIVVGGAIFFHELIKGKNIFNREFWKYAISFNLPLIVYYISQMIFNQSDRIMISHMCGMDKAAIYGVAYGIAVILLFVSNSINNSYIPWIYGKLKDGKQKDNKTVSLGISLLMALLLLAVIWFAPEIIRILSGKKYNDAIWVVPPIAMSNLLLLYSQFFANYIFYFENKKSLIKSSVLSAVLNIILNYIFIPKFGYYVAGYTTLVSYAVFTVQNYIEMRKILISENITEFGYDLKNMIIIFSVFILLGFLGMATYKYIIIRYSIIISIILILILNWKKMYNMWKGVLNEFSKKNNK